MRVIIVWVVIADGVEASATQPHSVVLILPFSPGWMTTPAFDAIALCEFIEL